MKKYTELAIYETLKKDELKDKAFKALDYGCMGISVRHPYLSLLSKYIPQGVVLSSPIDYPYGVSDIKFRNYQTIYAINHGANAIDLVANMSLIVNEEHDKFYEDLHSICKICRDKGASLRLMLEYRKWEQQELIAIIAQDAGIDFIFPSTGHRIDSFSDNLTTSIDIEEKCGINVITNGNIVTESHYKAFLASGVYGCRFNHLSALSRCLVYN